MLDGAAKAMVWEALPGVPHRVGGLVRGVYIDNLIFFPGCFYIPRVFIPVLLKGHAQERWGN